MRKSLPFIAIAGALIALAGLLVYMNREAPADPGAGLSRAGESPSKEKKSEASRSRNRLLKTTAAKPADFPAGVPPITVPMGSPAPAVIHYPDVFPESPDEIQIRLLEVSSGMGKEGVEEYTHFMNTLKVDRALSAALIHEALEEMPSQDRFETEGRKLVFALGELAHKSSMPALQEILDEPLPPFEEIGHHYNPQNEAIVTRGMALDSMLKVTDRYQDPETVKAMYHTLNDLLEDPETSTDIAIKAAHILQTHADDPAAEAARQQEILGADREFIASVEFVHELPPTDDE
jgi:hypothetical protein